MTVNFRFLALLGFSFSQNVLKLITNREVILTGTDTMITIATGTTTATSTSNIIANYQLHLILISTTLCHDRKSPICIPTYNK